MNGFGKFQSVEIVEKALAQVAQPSAPAPVRKVKSYPTVTLNQRHLPYISKLDTNEHCVLLVTVRKAGERRPDVWELREGRKTEKDIDATLEILSVSEPTSNLTAQELGY